LPEITQPVLHEQNLRNYSLVVQRIITMKTWLIVVALLLFCSTVFAVDACNPTGGSNGTGSDKPFNCAITLDPGGTTATFTWQSHFLSDSMVLICPSVACQAAFVPSRQVYSSTLTTSHSVTVNHLQPNGWIYYWSVANCSAGPNCGSNSTSWSTAPFDGPLLYFTTTSTAHPSGTVAIFTEMQGPQNVWQNASGYASIAVGVNLLVTDGTWNAGTMNLYTTAVTVDGQSCLPAVLGTSSTLGSDCGTTGIKFQLTENGNEPTNAASNNYNVEVGTRMFAGQYRSRGASGALNEPGSVALMYANGATPIGTHTLSVTFQVGVGNAAIGSPSVATWTFTVNPYPTFTVTAPSTFPAIPSYGTWLARAARYGTAEVTQLATAFSYGLFCNDNYSPTQTACDPCSVFNYDGNMIYKYLGDEAASVSATWASGHSYNIGDQIVASGSVETVTTAGTSGGIIPSGFITSVPGGVTSDGSTLRWTNGGNQTYWNQASEAVGMPYMDWANIVGYKGVTGYGSYDSEWNTFSFGLVMDFYRQNDTYSGNCNSGGGCVRLASGAINYFAGLNRPNYANLLNSPGSYWSVSRATVRTLPYTIESLVALCEITNNADGCMTSPEMTRRIELSLNTIDALVTYSPRDGVVSPYACCITAPQFDTALLGAALVYYYDLQSYLDLIPDARIPVELMRLYDWQVANFYNLTGSDYTFPYAFWNVGNNLNDPKYLWQQQLDNLFAPYVAWLWAMNGNSCTFATSGLGCQAVADQFFVTTLNAVPFSGKSLNEEYEWLNNFTGWRTGYALDGVTSFLATDHYVLPNHNLSGASYADVVGPFNGQTFPLGVGGSFLYPSASAIGGSSATMTWYTFEQITSAQNVELGTTPTVVSSTFNCPSVNSTFVAGTINLWVNVCTVTGLTPSTHYYFAVCGTDAAGNQACSAFAGGSYEGASLASTFSFTTM
jgi:hypothetical protein